MARDRFCTIANAHSGERIGRMFGARAILAGIATAHSGERIGRMFGARAILAGIASAHSGERIGTSGKRPNQRIAMGRRDAPQPRVRNGGLRPATALRLNSQKLQAGDQLSEKVCTGRRRHERLLEAYLEVRSVNYNKK